MKKLAIITGGISGEREISIKSATNFIDNLDTSKYSYKLYTFPEDKDFFLKSYDNFDLIIPIIHGIGGEDGSITSFAEFVGKPYLFSSSKTHSLAINKFQAGLLIDNLGIKTPKTYFISNILDLENIIFDKKYFIKPCNGGSSVDNGVFDNFEKAKKLCEKILSYDTVLVQEYIKKEREFTVSIIGDYDKYFDILAISEVITQKEIFDYDAKYNGDGALEIVHADIDNYIKNKLINLSKKIYKTFGCKTFSRIDFLYLNGEIYFLEVNTIPGFTKASFVPQAILTKYPSIKDFLNEIL